ncbi:OmpA family protein, partial [Parapedobacter sp. ISTM3]|uniref:OmpA family protein n=1 Tax=Parapedobacter sp. ISTM3 TaxID=2800130 RepID=UPI001906D5E8
LKANGKYAEAKQQFEAYRSQKGTDDGVASLIAGCDSAITWMANPTNHLIRNQTAVNTERSEFAVHAADGRVFYAAEPDVVGNSEKHGWTGNAFLRIFSADRSAANNALSSPAIAADMPNDARYHIGPVTADPDGKTLYVTRTYPGREGVVSKERRTKYHTNKLELYRYTKDASTGEWIAEPFAYNNVKGYSVGHAALAPDGNTIYFVSDMPGGHGGTDIWFCKRQDDGQWGTPENAGSEVNSAGNEMFPNIAPDGTLYYSSDGLLGMGGLDIFRSTGAGREWSTPENLRYPVNSPQDDFAFVYVMDDETAISGYLSSDRREGAGGDDIYSFVLEKPKIIIMLQGTTSNKQSGERLVADVTLFDGSKTIVASRQSTENGTFEFLLDGDRDYQVFARKAGFHPDSARVSTVGITKSDTLHVALLLDPEFTVGQRIELENIYYDFDKHNIRPDAAAILDRLVTIMQDYPTLKIELSSHTDSRGSDAYNMALSQRRAQAAVDYLVSRGIARERMVARGYGETRLVNGCGNGVPCSREQHQANRRTEVTVLEY